MGQAGHSFDAWKRPAHDGALRCVLCADTKPGGDRGWCAAAECLVCDECCGALLDGDPNRMVAMASNAGRVVTPDALLQACSRCDRAAAQIDDNLLMSEGDAPAPC